MKKLFFLILAALLQLSCSISGPAEDQWDEEEKEEKINLFGSDSKNGSGIILFGDKRKQPESSSSPTTSGGSTLITPPSVDQQSFQEFEEFKAWRRSQDPSSPNHQEFLDWQAYQQYLRFKAQQEQPPVAPAQ